MSRYFTVTEEEMMQLVGLPHSQVVLYFKLKEKMDYQTGLVGARAGSKTSLRALVEALYVEPRPGRENSGNVSVSKIRCLLQGLEAVGLVRRQSIVNVSEHRLIFKICAFEPKQDTPVQNKNSTVKDSCRNSAEQFGNHSENTMSYPVSGRAKFSAVLAKKTQQCCTPQYSNNIENNNKGVRKNYTTVNQQTISADFWPSEQTISEAKGAGIVYADDAIEIVRFWHHYLASGKLAVNWDSQFLTWLFNSREFRKRVTRSSSSEKAAASTTSYGARRRIESDVARVQRQCDEWLAEQTDSEASESSTQPGHGQVVAMFDANLR